MVINGIEINRIGENIWEIPKSGEMRVPGKIYISQKMLERDLSNDDAIRQVVNVA